MSLSYNYASTRNMESVIRFVDLPAEILHLMVSFLPIHYTYILEKLTCKDFQYKLYGSNKVQSKPLHNLCTLAAREGHLGVLIWARENGCKWDEKTAAGASEGGHLHILCWLRNVNDREKIIENYDMSSIKRPKMDTSKDICPWDITTCFNAAKNGDLEMVANGMTRQDCFAMPLPRVAT